jgi:predicted dehydrogenase
MAVIEAGKHVYCEWPLGRNTDEAIRMRDAADRKGIRHAVGLQGQVSPAINYTKDLIVDGYDGRVLSATMIGFSAPRKPARNPSEMGQNAQKKGARATRSGDGSRLRGVRGWRSRPRRRASLLRHPGLAQAEEKGRLKQGADFRHTPITGGRQTG